MKKITVINGFTDESHLPFEESLTQALARQKDAIQVENFLLRDMQIEYCIGCFGCWVKTPGKCVQTDDMPLLLKSIINSDLTVFVSPVRMGFVSSAIKKVNDKLIPLIHPYIGVFGGEFHHFKRYKRYPKLGLVLLNPDTECLESHEIITDVYKRLAINFKTDLAFSVVSTGSAKEVEHAINHF